MTLMQGKVKKMYKNIYGYIINISVQQYIQSTLIVFLFGKAGTAFDKPNYIMPHNQFPSIREPVVKKLNPTPDPHHGMTAMKHILRASRRYSTQRDTLFLS